MTRFAKFLYVLEKLKPETKTYVLQKLQFLLIVDPKRVEECVKKKLLELRVESLEELKDKVLRGELPEHPYIDIYHELQTLLGLKEMWETFCKEEYRNVLEEIKDEIERRKVKELIDTICLKYE